MYDDCAAGWLAWVERNGTLLHLECFRNSSKTYHLLYNVGTTTTRTNICCNGLLLPQTAAPLWYQFQRGTKAQSAYNSSLDYLLVGGAMASWLLQGYLLSMENQQRTRYFSMLLLKTTFEWNPQISTALTDQFHSLHKTSRQTQMANAMNTGLELDNGKNEST